MKVLFVTPPYHCGVVEVAGRWVPLQWVYLAGAVRRAGHTAVIYDAMTKWHTHAQIEQRLIEEAPDVVAMSVITATYLDGIEVLKNAKRRLPNVKTILGGVHPNFMYEEVFQDFRDVVDVIVRGEGEESIVEVLDAWQRDGDLGQIGGIAYWDAERERAVATATRKWIADLDDLPQAFDLLDWSDYRYFVIKNSKLSAISTSRGCPHGCSFCSQQKFWDRSWRRRSPQKLVEELRFQRDSFGVNVVLLTDEYPTADRDRWEEFLDRLIAANLGMYLLMETRVEDILRDRAILPKYRKAGIVHVYLGVEATDQATLDLIKKNIKVEQSQQALALVTAHGMVTETSLVMGWPDETPASIERTLQLSMHFNPDNAHYLAITPWPYAELWKDLEPYVRDRNYRNYNLIEPIIEPKAMSIKEVNAAMVECYRRFYTNKMTDFLYEKDPFRRHYLLTAARLIMSSSFIRTKIAGGIKMPLEMRRKMKEMAKAGICPVDADFDPASLGDRPAAPPAPVDVSTLVSTPAVDSYQ